MIMQALNLTIFGMGFVFSFLSLLVFVTAAMSALVLKSENRKTSNNIDKLDDELDEDTKLIIEQAIRQHRGA